MVADLANLLEIFERPFGEFIPSLVDVEFELTQFVLPNIDKVVGVAILI